MGLDDSYSKVLLHFDGDDASTTFTDESGKAWTAVGAAQLDTAQYRYGSASGYFTAAGSDAIWTADHADFTVGSDDFTVECWIMLETPTANTMVICSKRSTGVTSDHTIQLNLTSDKYPRFALYTTAAGTAVVGVASDAVTSDSGWHHIAGVRYGDVMYLYLDGYLVSSTAFTGSVWDNALRFSIGADNDIGAFPFPGWIDEFRFSKGIARYTGAFTPPGPFGVSAGSEACYFADGYSVY